ncbi:hypothetical protein HYU19_06005 [Candidatus Woesearchaeota archaeon]|nr:hypothetical protein [Candidatus Woesearchaeota archaeon]
MEVQHATITAMRRYASSSGEPERPMQAALESMLRSHRLSQVQFTSFPSGAFYRWANHAVRVDLFSTLAPDTDAFRTYGGILKAVLFAAPLPFLHNIAATLEGDPTQSSDLSARIKGVLEGQEYRIIHTLSLTYVVKDSS